MLRVRTGAFPISPEKLFKFWQLIAEINSFTLTYFFNRHADLA